MYRRVVSRHRNGWIVETDFDHNTYICEDAPGDFVDAEKRVAESLLRALNSAFKLHLDPNFELVLRSKSETGNAD